MTVRLGQPTVLREGTVRQSRPATAGSALLDRWGRTATDLRISLTDRCNLRCTYCMPAQGLDWMGAAQGMQREEILRLVRIAVEHLGVQQVRFTGGEPLLRKDLIDIIAGCASLERRPELSLTTNAIGLKSRAEPLARAGLDRINVSLDSVHPETFAQLARRPFLNRVLEGIDAAAAAGLKPIKINAVLVRGVNDTQAADLLAWALAGGHQLRFIEQMPLDADHRWDRTDMITAAEIRNTLGAQFTLLPDEAPRDGAPAELWRVYPNGVALTADNLLGRVGIIASVTEPFCADCRRTRLTADGRVRSCLFSHTETDLLGPLRAGADDASVADLWREAMWGKPKGHGLDRDGFVQPTRTMSAIGG